MHETHYDERQLQQLWDIVKGTRSLFVGNYIGLHEVEFAIPLEIFRETYKKNLKSIGAVDEGKVITDLEEAIKILSDPDIDIRTHHLSCAAKTGLKDDSAFCVHYKKESTDRFYSIAIPGINYIPDAETLNYLSNAETIKK
jgi:hypothetical protein